MEYLERYWPGNKSDARYLHLYQMCCVFDIALDAAYRAHGEPPHLPTADQEPDVDRRRHEPQSLAALALTVRGQPRLQLRVLLFHSFEIPL